ncbi:hypothetical protein KH172YL63_33570 [Bacillus sp. KH172YL63]|nr:hypothetical protein KH172YL63_33570 [Bacillus sp. KH172YL63]
MIGVQGEDSFGKSGVGVTPQERSDERAPPPEESEALRGNQQRFCPAQSRYVSPSFKLRMRLFIDTV